MKFDTDLILESFRPLEELTKMNAQANKDNMASKLDKLIDLLRNTQKGQRTAEDLKTKTDNYRLIQDVRQSVLDGETLSKSDMLMCNNLWKKYK